MPNSGTAVYSVKNEVERVLTGVGFSLGMRRLTTRGFVEVREAENYNNEPYEAAFLTDKAWNWIEQHEDVFTIHRPPKKAASALKVNDDDVPF